MIYVAYQQGLPITPEWFKVFLDVLDLYYENELSAKDETFINDVNEKLEPLLDQSLIMIDAEMDKAFEIDLETTVIQELLQIFNDGFITMLQGYLYWAKEHINNNYSMALSFVVIFEIFDEILQDIGEFDIKFDPDFDSFNLMSVANTILTFLLRAYQLTFAQSLPVPNDIFVFKRAKLVQYPELPPEIYTKDIEGKYKNNPPIIIGVTLDDPQAWILFPNIFVQWIVDQLFLFYITNIKEHETFTAITIHRYYLNPAAFVSFHTKLKKLQVIDEYDDVNLQSLGKNVKLLWQIFPHPLYQIRLLTPDTIVEYKRAKESSYKIIHPQSDNHQSEEFDDEFNLEFGVSKKILKSMVHNQIFQRNLSNFLGSSPKKERRKNKTRHRRMKSMKAPKNRKK